MNKTIHILNGDSTAQILERSGIKGDTVVWRELLCDGPLDIAIGSDKFWTKRYTFFEEEFGISKLEYFDKTIKEIVRLEDLSSYNEVVLWFEFDLFCQINLIALCTYLLDKYVKKTNYYLICSDKEKSKEQLKSISDYSPEEFTTLYNHKISLSKINFEFAKQSWNLYVENDIEKLEKFDFHQSSRFKYLQLAINQHLKRLPGSNGLNQIENKILEIINSNLFTKNEIVEDLLIWQQKETVYGFGDLQYFLYLKKLEKYYNIKEEKYYLNENGSSKIN